MTQSIALVPYSVRVRVKRDDEYLPLDAIEVGDNNFDFITFLDGYLNDRTENICIDEERQQSIEVESHTRTQRRISGILKGGTFGYEAELKNVETGEIKTREVEDCELLPFYFRFEHRRHQTSGLLLLQRFGVHGVKSGFQADVTTMLREIDEDLVLQINPLVTDQEITRLLGGGLKKIRYLRYTVPADAAEDLCLEDNEVEHCEMETVIKAKRDRFLSIPAWVRDLANDRAPAGDVVEIDGVEFDDVKIVISDGGKMRTLSVNDVRKFRMSIDVTEDVDIDDETGQPTFDSVDTVAREIIPELRTAIGWNDAEQN